METKEKSVWIEILQNLNNYFWGLIYTAGAFSLLGFLISGETLEIGLVKIFDNRFILLLFFVSLILVPFNLMKESERKEHALKMKLLEKSINERHK